MMVVMLMNMVGRDVDGNKNHDCNDGDDGDVERDEVIKMAMMVIFRMTIVVIVMMKRSRR